MDISAACMWLVAERGLDLGAADALQPLAETLVAAARANRCEAAANALSTVRILTASRSGPNGAIAWTVEQPIAGRREPRLPLRRRREALTGIALEHAGGDLGIVTTRGHQLRAAP